MAGRRHIRKQGTSKRSNNVKRRAGVGRMYSRQTDCWNCGSGDHQKNRCPLPSSLKCSFCQRRNIRSDECPCPKPRTDPQPSMAAQHWKTKVEVAIFVKIYGITVRALINPLAQETLICKAVADLVTARSANTVRKIILRKAGSLKMVSCVQVEMKTRQNLRIFTKGIIDHTLSEKVVVLGMQAIAAFGFKFFIGGQEAQRREQLFIPTIEVRNQRDNGPHRPQPRMVIPRAPRREPFAEREDDTISFLDEEEKRMIQEWN